MFSQRRFLKRLSAAVSGTDRLRIERVLASPRVFLAVSSLVAIYLDPSQPDQYEVVQDTLLIGYLAWSVVVLIWLRMSKSLPRTAPWVIHSVDLLFPAVITLFTEGPNSPFFLFFFFVLMTAAFRWGMRETVATAVGAVTLFSLEAGALTTGYLRLAVAVDSPLELNRLVIRSSYLLIVALLLGYLAENEKELRAEAALTSRMLGDIRLETGMTTNVRNLLQECMRVFGGTRALVAVQEVGTGRVFLWDAEAQPDWATPNLHIAELAFEQRQRVVFSSAADVFYARATSDRPEVLACDHEGRLLRGDNLVPADLLPLQGASCVLSLQFALGDEWTGRLYILGAQAGEDWRGELRFARSLMEQIAPALYNVYLLRKLRSRAGAIERARVARELHDGAIQSLIAVEMQIDVLRRQAAQNGSTASELARIQQLLRNEVMNLRELMQQMKPLDLTPRQLLDYLADLVDRFRRDTGISASFVSELHEVTLSPHVCRELARIVQEALVNVRKHSGARNVLVRFTSEQGQWKLVVDDDGQGFDFSGRLNHSGLEAGYKGPTIIKERVRAVGGELTIDSRPGQGARLEITVPQKAQQVYV